MKVWRGILKTAIWICVLCVAVIAGAWASDAMFPGFYTDNTWHIPLIIISIFGITFIVAAVIGIISTLAIMAMKLRDR